MRHTLYIPLVMVMLLSSQPSTAQQTNRTWITGGATYGGFTSIGDKDNTFDQNFGYKFEFGTKGAGNLAITLYSFAAYTSSNKVKESIVETRFQHHLWELMYFFGKKKVQPYLSLGIGFGSMKLEGMEGKDRFTMIPYGGGVQFIFAPVLIDIYMMPYSATKNQLGHNFGYEAGILLGYVFSK